MIWSGGKDKGQKEGKKLQGREDDRIWLLRMMLLVNMCNMGEEAMERGRGFSSPSLTSNRVHARPHDDAHLKLTTRPTWQKLPGRRGSVVAGAAISASNTPTLTPPWGSVFVYGSRVNSSGSVSSSGTYAGDHGGGHGVSMLRVTSHPEYASGVPYTPVALTPQPNSAPVVGVGISAGGGLPSPQHRPLQHYLQSQAQHQQQAITPGRTGASLLASPRRKTSGRKAKAGTTLSPHHHANPRPIMPAPAPQQLAEGGHAGAQAAAGGGTPPLSSPVRQQQPTPLMGAAQSPLLHSSSRASLNSEGSATTPLFGPSALQQSTEALAQLGGEDAAGGAGSPVKNSTEVRIGNIVIRRKPSLQSASAERLPLHVEPSPAATAAPSLPTGAEGAPTPNPTQAVGVGHSTHNAVHVQLPGAALAQPQLHLHHSRAQRQKPYDVAGSAHSSSAHHPHHPAQPQQHGAGSEGSPLLPSPSRTQSQPDLANQQFVVPLPIPLGGAVAGEVASSSGHNQPTVQVLLQSTPPQQQPQQHGVQYNTPPSHSVLMPRLEPLPTTMHTPEAAALYQQQQAQAQAQATSAGPSPATTAMLLQPSYIQTASGPVAVHTAVPVQFVTVNPTATAPVVSFHVPADTVSRGGGPGGAHLEGVGLVW